MDRAAMSNPFRYGEIATGNFFTNRTAELRELTGDIRSGQNVLISSPRRYGKTSLIAAAAGRLQRDSVRVAYVDLLKAPSKERFANNLATAIYTGMVVPVDRAIQRALDVFRRLPVQPKVTVNSDGSISLDFTGRETFPDLDRTIERLLELPGELASKNTGNRYALVLDEFQEVLTIDEALPAVMRSVFQAQGEVSHVFLGSKRHLMQNLFLDRDQPLYPMTKPINLGPIKTVDFMAFIDARFAATGCVIDQDALTLLVEITKGHPHDTQELAYFTWIVARERGNRATADTITTALQRVLEAEDARYTAIWERLTRNQRLLLTALLTDGRELQSEAYRRRHGLGAASSVARSAKLLVQQELIEFVPPDGYRIPDVFFRVWIDRLDSAPDVLDPTAPPVPAMIQRLGRVILDSTPPK